MIINGLQITSEERKIWNAISYKTEDPKKRITDFRIKWVNYRDIGGKWSQIDTTIVEAVGGGFKMTSAPFQVFMPKYADEVATFRNNNRWDVFTKSEIVDEDFDVEIQALGVSHVMGRIETGNLEYYTGTMENVNYVVYDNAFEDGVDLIYYVNHGRAPRLAKLIRFNKIPTKTEYSFIINNLKDCSFEVDKVFNPRVPLINIAKGKGIGLRSKSNSKRGMGFKPFKIWDSNKKIENIDSKFLNNTLTKVVDLSFFDKAVFPVFSDATSTFYPDPSVETSSVDGYTNEQQSTWADTYGGLGAFSNDSTGTLYAASWYISTTPYFRIYRSAILFDTSSLEDTATISSATFSLYGQSTENQDNDGDDFLTVVQSNPASNTAVVSGDYDSINSTEGIDSGNRIDIGNISTSDYNDFSLNATGIGWINKSGVTKLGIREGHDFLNSSVSTSVTTKSTIVVYSADWSGTSNDPKLVVVDDAVVGGASGLINLAANF